MNVIIIPVYNQLELVKKCVDSVLQTISNNEFVILVDDCSDKETMEWIKGIINYRNIFGIINETNKGFTYSVNEGIRRAIVLCENLFKKELEYICLLNSDTIIGTEDWFNKVIVAINSKKDVGICGVLSNNALHHSIPDIFYEYPKGYNIKSYSKFIEQESEQKNPYCPIVHGFCFVFKKKILGKIGLFDETNFPHYGSEDDYCIRALKEGFRTIVCDNVFVHHENCKSYTKDKRSKIVKKTIPLIKKMYGEEYIIYLWIKSANCLNYLKEKVKNKLNNLNAIQYNKPKYYNIGLTIPVYNRPKYLKQCLESIKNSIIPKYTTVLLIDDASSNLETQRIFDNFYIDGVNVVKIRNVDNIGIAKVLEKGYAYFYERDYEVLMHLESDAIVDKMWMIRMLQLYDNKNNIISGFNVGNCEQSKIIKETDTSVERNFIGGLNIMLNRNNYDIINEAFKENNNWDGKLAEIMKNKSMNFVCCKPSVIQHIGVESSDNMKHKSFYQATDFNNDVEINNY